MMNTMSSHATSPRTAVLGEREVERRQASSTVIHEEYLSAPPSAPEVKYVEVPMIEEVVKRVPRKEVREVEHTIPRTEIEWIETVREIPQIQYVEKRVEVPQVQIRTTRVPKKEYVDVPREVVRNVPKIEIVQVEQLVEVPGERIEVPKPYVVENKINVPRYVDNEVPMVVAQTIKPMITEGSQTVDVDVFEYEPQVVVVEVHVPKPVPSKLLAGGMVSETHRIVTVPAAQYNTMLKVLNTHIQEVEHREVLPYVVESSGVMPMLHGSGAQMMYPAPISLGAVEGYVTGQHMTRYVELQPGMTITNNGSNIGRPMMMGGGGMSGMSTTAGISGSRYATTTTTGPMMSVSSGNYLGGGVTTVGGGISMSNNPWNSSPHRKM